MLNAYGFLKLLHVLSVVVWVGGVGALSVVAWRMRNERSREALAILVRHAAMYGERVAGPASFVVLITGPMLVGIGRIGFGTFWVLWGFAGLTAHFWIGATALRRRTKVLLQLASGGSADDAAVLEASRKLWSAQLIYLAIMAAVVAAMVLKPTL